MGILNRKYDVKSWWWELRAQRERQTERHTQRETEIDRYVTKRLRPQQQVRDEVGRWCGAQSGCFGFII